MGKPVKRVDLSKLTAEQRAAFIEFATVANSVAGQRNEMMETAQAIFAGLVTAPQWGITEGARPGQQQPQHMWSVGHPQVNYVDHIERATDL
jgi:hypothetical protein